ncbi:MAG TPA: hypothetical protein VHW23_18395 [Kofleriaceae bacterium]|jgi:hypothetical protein|nr:hypothetical protein [Kofleriaceae bacterium]
MSDTDPILELDALLDPARLAAAWQVAHDRPPAAAVVAGRGSDGPAPEIDALEADAFEIDVPEIDALEADAPDADGPRRHASDEGEPAWAAPLPVALAHRQLLDELERTLAAPGLAAHARRVLSVPLAQLAAVIDPIDLAAAEATLDQLEDVLQALLSEAGWPASPASPERPQSED